ncbi:MAG: endonuclease [Thermoproteota archaeon]|nr:endonuclease [Thermoproteota archaeon]
MNYGERMQNIITALEHYFPNIYDPHVPDSFQLLVATILSQNTSDKNSQKTFAKLSERFKINPEIIADLSPEDILPLINSGGLGDIKSKRIVHVAKIILEKFGGDLSPILALPLDDAREILMSIKGIGPKTADVVLSFAGKKSVIPVDTNIFRVTNRIGLVEGRNYERTRRALEECIPLEKTQEMHLLLIQLGREICKPRNPKCSACPINSFCDYAKSLNVR